MCRGRHENTTHVHVRNQFCCTQQEIPIRVLRMLHCALDCATAVWIPLICTSATRYMTYLVVELYGLVNHVFVAFLEPQVLAPAFLDKPLARGAVDMTSDRHRKVEPINKYTLSGYTPCARQARTAVTQWYDKQQRL